MKIEKVNKHGCFTVFTDKKTFNEYVRFSEHAWYATIGESMETVYSTKELEDAFQAYRKENQMSAKDIADDLRNSAAKIAELNLKKGGFQSPSYFGTIIRQGLEKIADQTEKLLIQK